MCIIVLRCFVLVMFPKKMFEWATWWRWPTASQEMTTMTTRRRKGEGQRKSTDPKRRKRVPDKKVKARTKRTRNNCSRTESVPGISKRTAKKCCCVLIFSLLSWVLTEPKNKRVTTNPLAWCVLNWPICSDLLSSLDFAWAFPGANVAPHGFPYGNTSMDTSQREFQHSSYIVPTYDVKMTDKEAEFWNNLYIYIYIFIRSHFGSRSIFAWI